MEIERLYPERGPIAVDAALSGLRLGERAPHDRPYLVLNMVESIDGRTTLGGHVGELTGPVDQEIVYHLRTQADALLVGAGTVRTERYGNLLPDPALVQKREREGLARQPLVVIVSGRLALPSDLPLLHEPNTRILIATAAEGTLGFAHLAKVDYLRLPEPGGGVDCAALCRALRADYGVRSIVCEGGPSLNESLIGADLVDELFLSLAPKLVGGGERTLVDAAPAHGVREAELLSVATADHYLFLRYAIGRS